MTMSHTTESVEPAEGPTAGLDYLGYDHITWYVGNAKQAAQYYVSTAGFYHIAYKGLETGSRAIACHVIANNGITMAFVSALRFSSEDPREQSLLTEIHDHLVKHGDAVKDVAFTVDNAEPLYHKLIEMGAESDTSPHILKDEHGMVVMARVKTYGDTTHSLIERKHYKGPFLPGFSKARIDDREFQSILNRPVSLLSIDHVVGNQDWRELEKISQYYEQKLGFHRFWSVDDKDICTDYSALRSIVMASPDNKIKMPINEPAKGKRKSQIEEFLDFYNGPGVQHIALLTNDILSTVSNMKARGSEFISVPESYYIAIKRRLDKSSLKLNEDFEVVKRHNILIDFDENGYLLQIFTKPLMDRPTVFVEIIQRYNFDGFGVGNFRSLFEAIEQEQALRGNL